MAKPNQESGLMQIGDYVRLRAIPPDIATLDEETKRIFRFCLGRVYRVDGRYRVPGTDKDLLILDVSPDIDHRYGGTMNDIRVEEEYVEGAPGRTEAGPAKYSAG